MYCFLLICFIALTELWIHERFGGVKSAIFASINEAINLFVFIIGFITLTPEKHSFI